MFLRVVKWIEDNLDTVIESRPTVFVALSVIDQIVTSSNEDESWRILLEKLMLSLVKTDRVKVLFISNNSYYLFQIFSGFFKASAIADLCRLSSKWISSRQRCCGEIE